MWGSSQATLFVIGAQLLLGLPGAAAQSPDPLDALAHYTVLIPDHDDAARAIGLLTPLSELKLPDGTREVRLWVSGPGPILKSRVVRLVQTPDSVRGAVFQWWTDRQDPAAPGSISQRAMAELPTTYGESECRWVRSQATWTVQPDSSQHRPWIVACRLALPPTDWTASAAQLDSLHIGDLHSMEAFRWGPDGSLEVTKGADGTSVTGESLSGSAYHVFYWWQPDLQSSADAQAAQAILDLVFRLERGAYLDDDR
jgi:hypothetical protein